ncbi:MAG: hypothetical protein GTO00_04245, partial [Deltaproteobacteria bacterium]|nr:hypothetical protein [Deltaproteobacteria bacterium]
MGGKKDIRRLIWLVVLLLCAAAIAGCSSGREEGVIFDPEGGGHTSSWIFTHPAAAEQDTSSCTSCHGDDLGGGISGVSCMTSACHHDPIPDWLSSHPVSALPQASSCTVCHGSDLAGGFSNVSCLNSACHHDPIPNWAFPPAAGASPEHGASAKRAPGASGFESCQVCHGKEFAGGVSGVDCFLCHPGSPHPNDWLPGDALVHTTTDESNAPVCALCHFNEPGFGAHDPVDPPPGSEPGCFNSTLCHGADVGHPEGFALPTAHGASAKAAPGSSSGFSYCQNCHGTEFTGDIGVSCLNNAACHGTGVQSPHAPNWLPGDTFVHTTTAEGNAPVCGLCHLGGGSFTITPPTPVPPDVTPGCFNSTLCHGGAVAHSVPFLNHPQQALANFDSNCINCHAESGISPVAEAPTCDTCHQSGSPLDFGSCTSCHA